MDQNSARIMNYIRDSSRRGEGVLLISTARKMRNMHIRMLKDRLSEADFNQNVRVVGSGGVDTVSRGRILPALLTERMQALVEK